MRRGSSAAAKRRQLFQNLREISTFLGPGWVIAIGENGDWFAYEVDQPAPEIGKWDLYGTARFCR